MITAVGGIKGGGGKTTIATNLCVMRALEGKRVLLVDADEQRTASDWVCQRESLGIETNWVTIQLLKQSIHTQLKKMVKDYDDIIIDLCGTESIGQRAALCIAHQAIIPFKPKSFDMWTLGGVKTLIAESKAYNPDLKVFAVINQADSRGSDNEDAFDVLKESSEFICLHTPIGYRKAFANAAAEGLGIVELKKPDQKAIDEFNQLYSYIFSTNKINIK